MEQQSHTVSWEAETGSPGDNKVCWDALKQQTLRSEMWRNMWIDQISDVRRWIAGIMADFTTIRLDARKFPCTQTHCWSDETASPSVINSPWPLTPQEGGQAEMTDVCVLDWFRLVSVGILRQMMETACVWGSESGGQNLSSIISPFFFEKNKTKSARLPVQHLRPQNAEVVQF